jgi:predicted nucleic acid-binding protein
VGEIAFSQGARVYFDSSTVIYAMEKVSPYWEILRPVWEASRRQVIQTVSSELLIVEVLPVPLRQEDPILLRDYESAVFSRDFQLVRVSAEVLHRAADLRARYGLKTPDAIHVATAIGDRCDVLITNDVGFRRVQEIPVIVLKDLVTKTE